jgi:hypothetical protein
VEHTQMHHALKKVSKNSNTLAILLEFFVISLFHETKIPTVDMKVHMYSNFRRKNSKKMKSPSSMMNGRFDIPKCRGMVQKMEVV